MSEPSSLNPKTCLRIPVNCLKFLGIWYYEGPFRLLYLIYGKVIYCCISLLYAASMIMYVVKVWGDLAEMADGLYLLITVTCIIFKVGLLNYKKMNNIVEMVASEALNKQTKDQDFLLEGPMYTAHRNSFVFLSICTSIIFTLNLTPLLNGAYELKKLSIKAWFPFPYTVSPYYEIAYFYQFLGMWFGALVTCSLDALVAGLLTIACGQLQVLKHSLRNLRSRSLLGNEYVCAKCHNGHTQWICDDASHLNKEGANTEEKIYQEFVKCIRHHQAIIEYVHAIETTFSESMFAQFLTSMLVICITAFEISVIKPFTVIFFTNIIYMFDMILQLLFYCWYGNEVYLLSMTINEDIYNSDWDRFGPRVTKLMLIMMERSKKPMSIFAGKMFSLSLDTFTSILKSAYSFYAVLNQMEVDIKVDLVQNTPEINI